MRSIDDPEQSTRSDIYRLEFRQTDKQFTDQCKQHSSLDLLMTIIFKMGFRVWKQYNGQVPREEFARLEEASDWPTGLARHVFKRLDEDEELRHKLKSI